MEFIIELLLELIIEGSIEVSENESVPKWIRYPIILFVVTLFAVVIFGIIILGIYVLRKDLYVGLFLIVVGVILLIAAISKFIKKYIQRKNIIDN